MKNYIDLESVPYGEDCVQVSCTEDYLTKMEHEAKVYKRQLEREFGDILIGKMKFKITWNRHDFGSYASINLWFDDDDEEQCDVAYDIENDLPEFWDEQSLEELGKLRLKNTNNGDV